MRIQCISRPRRTSSCADDRDVVLGLAGDDAGRAAGAGVQIDAIAPAVLAACARSGQSVGGGAARRAGSLPQIGRASSCGRSAGPRASGGSAWRPAAGAAGLLERDAGAAYRRDPRDAARSGNVRADAGADAAGALAAVSARDRDGVRRLTGLNVRRQFDDVTAAGGTANDVAESHAQSSRRLRQTRRRSCPR